MLDARKGKPCVTASAACKRWPNPKTARVIPYSARVCAPLGLKREAGGRKIANEVSKWVAETEVTVCATNLLQCRGHPAGGGGSDGSPSL